MHLKHTGITYTVEQQPINHTHENPALRKLTGEPLLLVTTSAVIRDLKLNRYIILRNNQSECQFSVSSGFNVTMNLDAKSKRTLNVQKRTKNTDPYSVVRFHLVGTVFYNIWFYGKRNMNNFKQSL